MKNRLAFALLTLGAWALILCCGQPVFAQSPLSPGGDKEAAKSDDPGIALVRFYDLPAPNRRIIIHLTSPQDTNRVNADLRPSNITIRFLPSGKIIPATSINDITNPDSDAAETLNLTGFGDERIQIGILDHAEATPDPGDNLVRVKF